MKLDNLKYLLLLLLLSCNGYNVNKIRFKFPIPQNEISYLKIIKCSFENGDFNSKISENHYFIKDTSIINKLIIVLNNSNSSYLQKIGACDKILFYNNHDSLLFKISILEKYFWFNSKLYESSGNIYLPQAPTSPSIIK